ncbi:hypothetical protein Dimus_026689, partial [Dionaea muscipula]
QCYPRTIGGDGGTCWADPVLGVSGSVLGDLVGGVGLGRVVERLAAAALLLAAGGARRLGTVTLVATGAEDG